MQIRLNGTPEECAESIKRISQILDVVEVSRQYADRAPSKLVRVYIEVRL